MLKIITVSQIHAGFALDGFKLYWEDGTKQVIGPCKGGSARTFKVDPPSRLVRLTVRSGAWMDAVSVCWEGGETGLCGGGGGELRVLGEQACRLRIYRPS